MGRPPAWLKRVSRGPAGTGQLTRADRPLNRPVLCGSASGQCLAHLQKGRLCAVCFPDPPLRICHLLSPIRKPDNIYATGGK